MKTILRSEDFSCPSCVTKIETSLRKLSGVEHAKVYFSTGRIEVHHDAEKTPVTELVDAVRALGYESRPSPF
jgi:copper chaperone CopZ